MKTTIQKLAFVAGLTTLTAPAFAQLYAGGSIGQADFEDADTQTSFELKTGYQLNDYFAVEAFYLQLGEGEQNTAAGILKNDVDGVGVAALGIYPINEQFDIYGRLGMYSWESDNSFDGAGTNNDFSNRVDDNDFIYGVGASWKVNELIKVNAAYDAIELDEFDRRVDNFSIGASLMF